MSSCNRIATVLVAGFALAGMASAAGNGKIAAADSNKDRALSKVEACAGKTPRICKNFEAIDANKDGQVTRAELRAYRDMRRAARGLPAKP